MLVGRVDGVASFLRLLLLLFCLLLVVVAVHAFGVGWGVDARGGNLDMFEVTAHACWLLLCGATLAHVDRISAGLSLIMPRVVSRLGGVCGVPHT